MTLRNVGTLAAIIARSIGPLVIPAVRGVIRQVPGKFRGL